MKLRSDQIKCKIEKQNYECAMFQQKVETVILFTKVRIQSLPKVAETNGRSDSFSEKEEFNSLVMTKIPYIGDRR